MSAEAETETVRAFKEKIRNSTGSMVEQFIKDNPDALRPVKMELIKASWVNGIIMAMIVVGLWNVIAALKIDLLVTGSASLGLGLIFMFVQFIVLSPRWRQRLSLRRRNTSSDTMKKT